MSSNHRAIYKGISLLLVVLAALWGIIAQSPSADDFTSGDETTFSQKNALAHVRELSKEPHYVGSKAHGAVHDYLVNELRNLGLAVDQFEQFATGAGKLTAASTHNIITRIKGSSNGKALALLSHYDSASHSSLGASDAASGVAVILEGVRAFLASNQKSKNDIIIIFTDGEEQWLLGANAFVKYHPWAQDIGLVLNFEARGSGGPSYMLLETNGGNSKLIQAFSDAGVNYPVANSLLYSIYKALPNDTDLTAFREEGDIDGFNFTFIDDHFDYHTMQDSFERLDRASLNHQADYLMTLLGYFSRADLSQLKSEQDRVYFNFAGAGMITYPFALGPPLLLLASMILIVVSVSGIKRGALTVAGAIYGAQTAIRALITAGLIGYIGWRILLALYPEYADIPQGFTYNGHLLLSGFIALAIAAVLSIYHHYDKGYSYLEMLLVPVAIWLIINVFIAAHIEGAGFFIIPVLLALIGCCLLIFTELEQGKKQLLFALISLPAVIILAPLIPSLVVALGLKMTWLATLFTALTLMLLLPIWYGFARIKWLTYAFYLLPLLLFTLATVSSGYSSVHKKPNSLNYVFDQDSQRAYMISHNRALDDFVGQFFTEQATASWDTSIYPSANSGKDRSRVNFFTPTEPLPLQAVEIEVLEDKLSNDERTVKFRLTPKRALNMIRLASIEAFKFNRLSVNGQVFSRQGAILNKEIEPGFFFKYVFASPTETVTIELTVADSEQLQLKVYEIAFDLFERMDTLKPRSDLYMPEPFVVNDATIIGQSVNLDSKKRGRIYFSWNS